MGRFDFIVTGDQPTATSAGDPITIDFCQTMLASWLSAEAAIATGKSYVIGDRRLDRPDMPDVRKQIAFWRSELDRLLHGRKTGARVKRVIPRDL